MMSGWVMWTISGIFENIGVVHEGMETISRPHTVLDTADAKPLAVNKGEIRFEGIHFHYGAGVSGAADQPVRVIDGLNFRIAPGEQVGLLGRSGWG